MDRDNKKKYAEVLLHAYHNKILKIIWSAYGFSLGIDSEKEGLLPELKEKNFRQYAVSIIKIAADLAEGGPTENVSGDDLETAKAIYAQEMDLKKHLYIKKNSKVDCFKHLECQIISYRNDKNPKETDADSALIKIITEKDDKDSSVSFEISRRDLGEVITYLEEIKAKMDRI